MVLIQILKPRRNNKADRFITVQIYIIAVGEKSPAWIETGINQYINRMPRECNVKIVSIPTSKRSKNKTIKQAQVKEQEQLIKHTPKNSYRIALDELGQSWTTNLLAEKLHKWMQSMPRVTFYIGGPDGFSAEFLEKVDFVWSISSLTLPHMLVRVLLAEQLYRALTIIQRHPYHRE